VRREVEPESLILYSRWDWSDRCFNGAPKPHFTAESDDLNELILVLNLASSRDCRIVPAIDTMLIAVKAGINQILEC
jgi:hypothetical protein